MTLSSKVFVAFAIQITAGILFLFFLSSCSEFNRANERKVKTIVWIGPLTGPVSALGLDNMNALKLVVDKHNAQFAETDDPSSLHINLIVKDDQYDSTKTIEIYQEVIREIKPTAVFLTTYTSMFAIADQALRDNVLVINSIDSDEKLSQLNKNIFLVAKATEALAEVLSDALINHNKKRVVLLVNEIDDFMPNMATLIEEQLSELRIQISTIYYNGHKKDFQKEIVQTRHMKPDAFVLLGYQELGHFMNQVRQENTVSSFYTPNTLMKHLAPETIEGTYYSDFTYKDGNTRKAKAFLDEYNKVFHTHPVMDWTAMQGYDAGHLVIKAIHQSIEKNIKDEKYFIDFVRKYLFSSQGYEGVSGTLSVKKNGTTIGIKPSLYRLRDGKGIQVEY